VVEVEAVVFGLEHRVEACGRKRTRMKIVRDLVREARGMMIVMKQLMIRSWMTLLLVL
jgi:hypothetical protein